MKPVKTIDEVKVGDVILYKPNTDITRVYEILAIENRNITNRRNVYTSDGKSGSRILMHHAFTSLNAHNKFFLLNEEEINHFVKLSVFE